MLEAYGIDVLTKEVRDRHTNAVLEILFSGMLAEPISPCLAPEQN